MAFPADYILYDEYVVASGQIAASASDFPVYVDLSDLSAQFWANVRSDGGDIRVTLDDGTTQLPVDVVSIDTGAQTGEIHFKAATLSTSSRTFRIWVNGTDTMPATSSTYGRDNVWSDYTLVAHLQEGQTTGAGAYVNSTGGANGTGTSMSDAGGNGQLGMGSGFDGSDDEIEFAITSPSAVPLTIQAWVNPDTTVGGADTVASIGGSSGSARHEFALLNVNGVAWALAQDASGNVQSTKSISANVWQLWHAAFASATSRTIYVDAVAGTTNTTSRTPSVFDRTRIGQRAQNLDDQNFDGDIDEVRIRGAVLSATWITTEHNNQDDHSTWVASVTAKSTATPRNLALLGVGA